MDRIVVPKAFAEAFVGKHPKIRAPGDKDRISVLHFKTFEESETVQSAQD